MGEILNRGGKPQMLKCIQFKYGNNIFKIQR